jgi:hypothetical protein
VSNQSEHSQNVELAVAPFLDGVDEVQAGLLGPQVGGIQFNLGGRGDFVNVITSVLGVPILVGVVVQEQIGSFEGTRG